MSGTHVFRLIGLVCLVWLAACGSSATPTSAPGAGNAVTSSATPNLPTTLPPTLPPSPVPATSTPVLQITLITPTPVPTQPPTPTPLPLPTGAPVSDNPGAGPTTAPRPSGLGSSAGDGALIAVLQRCWNVSDTRQLNGNSPDHRNAFECARQLLLDIVNRYPAYALVHRVLAWGYFYKDNDSAKAIKEYRAAADIYKAQGNTTGESEARMRLALLLVASNPGQGCAELAQAGTVDPTNARALDYYAAFNCRNLGSASSGGGQNVPPPAPQIDLASVRGKILFKSEREGYPAYYMMDSDGKNVQRISGATYDAAKQWESWSPDREMAATVRPAGFTNKFGYDNDIWITDPQGNGRPLVNPANDYDPAWSPVPLFDGQTWIAFVSNRGDLDHPENIGEELWIMHDDGRSPFRITCNGPFYSKHPTWSPDGTKIAFYSTQQGNHDQIFVMDVSRLGTLQDNCVMGENPVNLSNNEFAESEPVWVK